MPRRKSGRAPSLDRPQGANPPLAGRTTTTKIWRIVLRAAAARRPAHYGLPRPSPSKAMPPQTKSLRLSRHGLSARPSSRGSPTRTRTRTTSTHPHPNLCRRHQQQQLRLLPAQIRPRANHTPTSPPFLIPKSKRSGTATIRSGSVSCASSLARKSHNPFCFLYIECFIDVYYNRA